MRAWFVLTNGRYREVIEAAQAGQDAAPGRSVVVQLLGQEAKAWARMGNHRHVTRALEKGRVLLDSLPFPELWVPETQLTACDLLLRGQAAPGMIPWWR